jgi:hypothetical protein
MPVAKEARDRHLPPVFGRKLSMTFGFSRTALPLLPTRPLI